MKFLTFVRDYWPLVTFLALIVGYAAHHWLGQRYVTKKNMDERMKNLRKDIQKELDGATTRLGTAEKLLAGFNDLLATQNTELRRNTDRIEAIDKYGSAPLRKVEHDINEVMGRLREIKTSLIYIRKEREEDEGV